MVVRFKLDENLPRDAAALLRDAGHDVQTDLDERLGGNPDPEVLDACRTENRVLITFDLDFSDIRRYPPARHIVVSPQPISAELRARIHAAPGFSDYATRRA